MRRWLIPAAVGTTLATTAASAAGFAIREQSGSFQGLSFAGVAAGGDDISTMYFNPATLALHDGASVHASLSYILPRSEFTLAEATDGGTPFTPERPTGGGEGGDIADDAVVPALYGAWSRDRLHLGLGVTAPFGLRTAQSETWAGRYHATESELTTININPALAYRVSDRLSVAAGFVAQYADATLANASDLRGALGVPLAPPSPATDGLAEIEGDDWDFGFTLGVLAEPIEGTRIGLGYRSQINHSLEGDFELSFAGSAVRTTGGRAALATPQVASLGVRQRVTEDIDLLGTFEWTGWSSFDELRISFDDGTPDTVTDQDWHDSVFVAVGGEYRPRPDLVLQAGAAFDQSPINDTLRTPRIPGNDRTWLSFGAAWTPRDWLSIGGGYSRIFVADGDVDLDEGATITGGRGVLRGSFENSIDILVVHGTLRF